MRGGRQHANSSMGGARSSLPAVAGSSPSISTVATHPPSIPVVAPPPPVSVAPPASRQALPLATILAVLYVILIAAAELLTATTDARWGLALHIAILTSLLVHASVVAEEAYHKLLLALALAPLVRILSLSMPLENVDLIYWYAIVGAPLLITALVVARTLGLTWTNLGLTLRSLPIQVLVATSGIAFGIAEYFILKPEPLIDEFNWRAFWLPALILLFGTGFNEELVFRGVMQSAASHALGKPAILYVTVVFAVLHLGYKSAADVAFVFAVGLLFGWIAARTRSLLGVSLSHGATNIALYLVVPFLGIAAATTPSIGVQNVQESTYELSQEIQRMQALGAPVPPEPIASPIATPTATPIAPATPEPLRQPPPQPIEAPSPTETYIVQPGDSLASIASLYQTSVEELLALNELPQPDLLYSGQTIVVPARSETAPNTMVHTVQVGETLSAIAGNYGTTVEELLELNDLPDPNVIPVGTRLTVPRTP